MMTEMAYYFYLKGETAPRLCYALASAAFAVIIAAKGGTA